MATVSERINVAVIMGGPSMERGISLETGKNIYAALDRGRYNPLPIEITGDSRWRLIEDPGSLRYIESSGEAKNETEGKPELSLEKFDDKREIERTLRGSRVDVAFIALHGAFGEDGSIQALLDFLGIAYTGSGVLASALGMDKTKSRAIFNDAGLLTPTAREFSRKDWRKNPFEIREWIEQGIGFPAVAKPADQGSSIGISLVHGAEDLEKSIEAVFEVSDRLVLEEFIQGTEVTCAVIGNTSASGGNYTEKPFWSDFKLRCENPTNGLLALPLTEIIPADGHSFFDFSAKYTPGECREITPARINPELTKRCQEIAKKAYKALGCDGFARIDMIIRADEIFILEANTIPGMTNTSLLPQAAKAIGVEFPELLNIIVGLAVDRCNGNGKR